VIRAAEIDAADARSRAASDVSRLLDGVAADGVSRRTVNRHREVVVAMFNYALRPERRDRWQLAENPAAATPKRREDGPGRLEVFTVEQVEALARCAAAGTWRTARANETPTVEAACRDEDRQLGELLRVAAYTGLRRGRARRAPLARRPLGGTGPRRRASALGHGRADDEGPSRPVRAPR
jgi:hypothetical protein